MRILVNNAGFMQMVCDEWPEFSLDSLLPIVEIDGQTPALTGAVCQENTAETVRMDYVWSGICHLHIELSPFGENGLRLQSRLRNASDRPVSVGKVVLLHVTADRATPAFGKHAAQIVVYKQSIFHAEVVSLVDVAAPTERAEAAEPTGMAVPSGKALTSEHVWAVYDREAGQAMLAGFESNARWTGAIELTADARGTLTHWSVGFANNDLLLLPHEEVALESLLLQQGRDPLALLDAYGAATSQAHAAPLPVRSPVSWCSWYPYRLGVTEERILDNARLAAQRLLPLGLGIIEVDLGWEHNHLPSSFEENAKFPHGLGWLSQQLGSLGFGMGCWKAPYQISEFDPLAGEHPEWLIPGEDGQPVAVSTWFWQPGGRVYALDLTHPGAQQWLRTRIRSLAERGIRYFKADFIGQPDVGISRRRFDRTIAAGAETGRIGAQIIREELPEALILNCGGPEMPGKGQWPLLYSCLDTGNTGLIAWEFQQNNFRAFACHLWKNRNWGIIQASCLCVGLPGTLEEARLRATVALLSGGQIDISDTLITLPEERWAVLEATLPPLGYAARAIDLFEPVFDPGSVPYEALCRGEARLPVPRPHPPGSVWHLRVKQSWEEWDLVAVFCYATEQARQTPSRYRIPLARLNLDSLQQYWAYEFWSGQYLGVAPSCRRNPDGYEHPGDLQDLLVGDGAQALELAFTGPAVKLICLRTIRPHPWIVGTSFHQSCGTELTDVRWDAAQATLSGRLLRPIGQNGFLSVTDAGLSPVSAIVDGEPIALVPGANGAWKLKLAVRNPETHWSIQFKTTYT